MRKTKKIRKRVLAAIRLADAIAGTLGVPDNDRRVRWQYAQTRTAGDPRVVVTVEKKI